MAGTYNPYGPDGVIWSSVGPQPHQNLGGQLFNLGAAAGLGLGVAVGLQQTSVGREGLTAYDFVQRSIRSVSAATPFGIGNTFRLPEFMSHGLSGAGQGLPLEQSVLGGRKVSAYTLGPEFTQDANTRKLIRSAIGEQAFTKSGLDSVADGDYQLRFERDPKGSGRGSYFYREAGYDPATGKPSTAGKWNLLSKDVKLMEAHGAPDVIDLIGGNQTPFKTNQATYSVFQNTGFTENRANNIDNAFTVKDPSGKITNRAKFVPVPSVAGAMGSFGDVQRRASLLFSPVSFGAQRWNRLVDATLDQIPYGKRAGKALFGDQGVFSLKVTPGPAHKMMAQLGLKTAKIGGAYLALEQVDWFRREFGLPGEVIASGGLSLGLGALVQKTKAGSPKTAMGVAVASFFGQMLLPGFGEGVIPGLARTAGLAHQGTSAIGSLTGASIYRRTLEGFLPGVSDWKTGAFLGLGAVALSYSKMPQYLMDRPGTILPSSITNRIGFMGPKPTMPRSLGQFYMDEVVNMASEGTPSSVVRSGKIPGTSRIAPWKIGSQSDIANFLGKPLDKLNRFDRLKLMGEMHKRARKGGIDDIAWMQEELLAKEEENTFDYKAFDKDKDLE